MNDENIKGLSTALISIILGILSIISLVFSYLPEMLGTAALISGTISKAINKNTNRVIDEISTAGIILGLIGALTALAFILADKSIINYILPLFSSTN